MFKDKKSLVILSVLLAILILPRILAFIALGPGMVPTDAEGRYFPQAEELSHSALSFFSMTGPLYTAFLLLFQKLAGNMIVGPVIVQHLLGIAAAFMVFFYFRRVNLALAFIVTAVVYSSLLTLYDEHSILREALSGFLLVSWVIVLFKAVADKKHLTFLFGLLAAGIGVLLCLVRIEFIVLFVLMPVVLLLGKKMHKPGFSLRSRQFFLWKAGYGAMLLLFVGAYFVLPGHLPVTQKYGGFFNIAWHSLQPQVFYYDNSRYPDLIKAYQKVVETADYISWNEPHFTIYKMQPFYDATAAYMSRHPEISLSMLQLMDKVYLEMAARNTGPFLLSYLNNLQNHLLGQGESIQFAGLYNKILGPAVASVPPVSFVLKVLTVGLDWLYGALQSVAFLWLFLVSLIFAAFRWKKLPFEVVIALVVSLTHILVLAFVANASHRFRFAIDPFLYFGQVYLIYIFVLMVFKRPVAFIFSRLQVRRAAL